MDVLHFVKDHYERIKIKAPGLVGGDVDLLAEESLKDILADIRVAIRIADDLILPELADATQRGLKHLADAGDQTTELDRIISSGEKSSRLGDARRRELLHKLHAHLDHMEQLVLPLMREEISTQVREDLGQVAEDYHVEARSSVRSASRAAVGSGSQV